MPAGPFPDVALLPQVLSVLRRGIGAEVTVPVVAQLSGEGLTHNRTRRPSGRRGPLDGAQHSTICERVAGREQGAVLVRPFRPMAKAPLLSLGGLRVALSHWAETGQRYRQPRRG